jgi:hypothetical protein
VYVEADDHLRRVEEMTELEGGLVAKAEYSEAELLASRASTAVDRAKADLEAALLPSGRAVESQQLPIALTVTRRGKNGVFASKEAYAMFQYLAECYNELLTRQNVATRGDESLLREIKRLVKDSKHLRELFHCTIPTDMILGRKQRGMTEEAVRMEDDAMLHDVIQYWHTVRIGEFARDLAAKVNLAANAVPLRGTVAMAGARRRKRHRDGDDGGSQPAAKSPHMEGGDAVAQLRAAELEETLLATASSASHTLSAELDRVDEIEVV